MGPIRLRAYGSYAIQVVNPRNLLEQLVSTDGLFQTDEISDHIRNMIVSAFSSWIGHDQTPMFDLVANYQSMGEQVRQAMQTDLQSCGTDTIISIAAANAVSRLVHHTGWAKLWAIHN